LLIPSKQEGVECVESSAISHSNENYLKSCAFLKVSNSDNTKAAFYSSVLFIKPSKLKLFYKSGCFHGLQNNNPELIRLPRKFELSPKNRKYRILTVTIVTICDSVTSRIVTDFSRHNAAGFKRGLFFTLFLLFVTVSH
jgi:hypothetical protein